jgi:hypothetical protein
MSINKYNIVTCWVVHAVDKSRDSQSVLLECDVIRLRGSVFIEP